MSQLEPPVSVLPGLAPVIEISKWSGGDWRPPSCSHRHRSHALYSWVMLSPDTRPPAVIFMQLMTER